MEMGTDFVALAHRLSDGARRQVALDYRRLEALDQLPDYVYHVAHRDSYSSIMERGL